jgi:hypothetical protein
MAFVPRM